MNDFEKLRQDYIDCKNRVANKKLMEHTYNLIYDGISKFYKTTDYIGTVHEVKNDWEMRFSDAIPIEELTDFLTKKGFGQPKITHDSFVATLVFSFQLI